MNFALVLICGWIFCISQDLWMNKSIKLQIKGRAERLGRNSSDAEEMIDAKMSPHSGIYFCVIYTLFIYGITTFNNQVVLFFISFVSLALSMFVLYLKIRVYLDVSEFHKLD